MSFRVFLDIYVADVLNDFLKKRTLKQVFILKETQTHDPYHEASVSKRSQIADEIYQ